jgi:hypothetical protein
MQRWKTRFEHEGYEDLFDRRRGIPSPKRVPLKNRDEVLRLYQEQYFDFNVRHFHEKFKNRKRAGRIQAIYSEEIVDHNFLRSL